MELTFKNNLSVKIDAIYQERTYSGLLEGLPTRKMNEQQLHRLPLEAQNKLGKIKVYLIEPSQKKIEYEEYPFGEPASLPRITCMAKLENNRPARNEEMDFSMLILVWFQSTFAFPIEESILKTIETIDWTEIAQDCEW